MHLLIAPAAPHPMPPLLSMLQPEWPYDNSHLTGAPSNCIPQWLRNSFKIKVKKREKTLNRVYESLPNSPAASSTTNPESHCFYHIDFAYAVSFVWRCQAVPGSSLPLSYGDFLLHILRLRKLPVAKFLGHHVHLLHAVHYSWKLECIPVV